MSFDIKDLPYAHFEQLGMSRKDVITMPHQELASMLNGGRTSLLSLNIKLGEGMNPIKADAKLSLSRNPDNTLSLNIHPILSKPTNTINATPEQWERMLKGEAIVKDSKTLNGTLEPHIHQLDKQTNEILTVRVNAIQIPNAIKDIVLTADQKDQFKKGLPVEFETKAKEHFIVRLDLNEPKGHTVTSREQSQETKLAASPGADKGIENVSRGVKM